jgi:hypothetical protein
MLQERGRGRGPMRSSPPSQVLVLRLCEAARTSRDLSRARRGRGDLCHHRGELHHPVSTRQGQGQGLLDRVGDYLIEIGQERGHQGAGRARHPGDSPDLQVELRSGEDDVACRVIAVSLDGQRAVRQEFDRVLTRVIRTRGDLAGAADVALPLPHHPGQDRLQLNHPILPPAGEEPPLPGRTGTRWLGPASAER